MITKLLKPEVRKFILSNTEQDAHELMLKAKKFPNLPMREIVDQIQSRKKAKNKIPQWYNQDSLIFPPPLSMEQCSSEQTAIYKQGLLSGESLVDLTGGAGVDTYYLSKEFNEVSYVERQQNLVELAKHNFEALGVQNIQVHHLEAENFFRSFPSRVDAVFIDPARRGESNNRVHKIEDCTPDLTFLLPKIAVKTDKILVKASPMLDIKAALNTLKNTSEVHVVAVKGEVKEILFVLVKTDFSGEPIIKCVNLRDGSVDNFDFTFSEEMDAEPAHGNVKNFIYEPNASILKGGAFKVVGARYEITKLNPNTHLYTSQELVSNFSGRVFKVIQQVSLSRKNISGYIPTLKANVSSRNFPMSVSEIRKKSGLRDGGDRYVYALTDMEGPKVFLCERVA